MMVGDSIEKRLAWLDALEEAGVDNWEGLDEAIKIYQKWTNKEKEKYDENV